MAGNLFPAKVLRNEDGTFGVAILDQWGRVDPFRDLVTDAPYWSRAMGLDRGPVFFGNADKDYQQAIWMQ